MKFDYNKLLKIAIVLSAFIGILAHIISFGNPLQKFTYFTLQSNLLVGIIYLVLIFKKTRNRTLNIIENQVVVAIVLTGLVFNIMLRPAIDANVYNPNNFSDVLLHSLTPLLVIFDRILFNEKGNIRVYDPFFWLVYPLLYWLFTVVFVFLGGNFNTTNNESNYPYFFMNFNEAGFGYFLLVIAFIVIIGYLIYLEDFLRNKKRSR